MPDREALQEIERLLVSPVRCPECREPVGWDPPAEHAGECFVGDALTRVRALLAEPEPTPIRGRWTLVANDRTGEVFDVVRNEVIGRGMRSAGWLMIEVVPVPDEQAIGRARADLYEFAQRVWGWGAKEYKDVAAAVEVVLLALEQPESPDLKL